MTLVSGPHLTRSATWIEVCPADRLIADRGAAALVEGHAVAVFLLSTGDVIAIDNVDPISGASVLSRGIIGDAGGVATVASPIYKQRFALDDGACLDDPAVRIAVHEARIVDGQVEVRLASTVGGDLDP